MSNTDENLLRNQLRLAEKYLLAETKRADQLEKRLAEVRARARAQGALVDDDFEPSAEVSSVLASASREIRAARISDVETTPGMRSQLESVCGMLVRQGAELAALRRAASSDLESQNIINQQKERIEQLENELKRAHFNSAHTLLRAKEEGAAAAAAAAEAAAAAAAEEAGLATHSAGRQLIENHGRLEQQVNILVANRAVAERALARAEYSVAEQGVDRAVDQMLVAATSQRAVQRMKLVEKLTTRVEELSAELVATRAAAAAAAEAAEAATTAAVLELETENATLRRILEIKTQELETVRALGRRVLQQRSDVEGYLAAALQRQRPEDEMELIRACIVAVRNKR